MKRAKKSFKLELKYFGSAGILWLAVSLLICQFWETSPDVYLSQVGCTILWLVSVLDFFVLRMLADSIFQKIAASSRGRQHFSRWILFWGFFKAVCLGLFIIVLLKGHKIPLLGLSLGIATLGVVPLAGGFFWSWSELRKGLKDA